MLMWIGGQSSEGEIQAWSFFVKMPQEVPKLKGVLTKVLYETNLQESLEKNQEQDDSEWL